MKTFKACNITTKKARFEFIATLHHVSLGIYWGAPRFGNKRRITISIHIPFALMSVSWIVKVKDYNAPPCTTTILELDKLKQNLRN